MPQPRPGAAEPERTPPGRPDRRLRSALVGVLDLPPELVFDLARLTLVVPLQLTVENHRGLVEFHADRVVVATASGRIAVSGKDMRIDAVRSGEIVITGDLRAISFGDGGG